MLQFAFEKFEKGFEIIIERNSKGTLEQVIRMILYFTNTLPEKIILKIERRAQSFYFWWFFLRVVYVRNCNWKLNNVIIHF